MQTTDWNKVLTYDCRRRLKRSGIWPVDCLRGAKDAPQQHALAL